MKIKWIAILFGIINLCIVQASSQNTHGFDIISVLDGKYLQAQGIIISAQENEIIFMGDLLDTEHLDSLTTLAESSFGNFTNILRTFLNAEYDIRIHRPDTIIFRESDSNNEKKISRNFKNNYTIVPNPSSDCIQVKAIIQVKCPINVEIYNSNGQRIKSVTVLDNYTQSFLQNEPPGLYIIRINNSSDGYIESYKLIFN